MAKRFSTIAAFAIASAAVAAPASALTTIIDDFTTNQIVTADPASSDTVLGGGATGIAATDRTFFVDNTVPDAFAQTSLKTSAGELSFNNDSGARGFASITYTGLGDLIGTGTSGYFFFEVVAFDGNADFAFEVEDGSGHTATYTESLFSGFNPQLQFSELTGYEIFDFTNVTRLVLSIDSTNTADSIDGRLASFSVVSTVPLPASGLLLLGSFGAIAAARKRKSRTKETA